MLKIEKNENIIILTNKEENDLINAIHVYFAHCPDGEEEATLYRIIDFIDD